MGKQGEFECWCMQCGSLVIGLWYMHEYGMPSYC